jgi:hypothetical protein
MEPGVEPMSIQDLLDKQAISEVIYRRARAVDRRDVDLALGCYHEGATEDHDGFVGPPSEFIRKAWPAGSSNQTMFHAIANILIDLKGDLATVESYVVLLSGGLDVDGTRHDALIAARYLDDFARRNGRWAIMKRRQVYDWSRVEQEGTLVFWNLFGQDQSRVLLGSPDSSDPSYVNTAT